MITSANFVSPNLSIVFVSRVAISISDCIFDEWAHGPIAYPFVLFLKFSAVVELSIFSGLGHLLPIQDGYGFWDWTRGDTVGVPDLPDETFGNTKFGNDNDWTFFATPWGKFVVDFLR